MADVAVQISSDAYQVFSFTAREHENIAHEPGDPKRDVEQAHEDLLALTVQQSEIEKRIGVVRRTLLALVGTFGPDILSRTSDAHGPVQDFPKRRSGVSELCCKILEGSPAGLTSQQLTEVIQRESPWALAGFTKPGVVTANVLRVLRRSGEVECRREHNKRLSWRSTGRGVRQSS